MDIVVGIRPTVVRSHFTEYNCRPNNNRQCHNAVPGIRVLLPMIERLGLKSCVCEYTGTAVKRPHREITTTVTAVVVRRAEYNNTRPGHRQHPYAHVPAIDK